MPTADDLARELREAGARAERMAGSADPIAFARRPEPGRWSAAECFEHLNLTSRAFLPRIEEACAELRERGLRSDGPYKMDLPARILRWMLEPPVRFRMPTSAAFQPHVAERAAQVGPEFQELQGRVLQALENAHGLALDRVRIVSPFSSSVRYNVAAAFALIAVHQRRHLWQAERALGVSGA